MRIDLHVIKSEEGWAASWWSFWRGLSDAAMSIVQWAFTLGAIRYARDAHETTPLYVIDGILNLIFLMYLWSFAFMKLDIVVFEGDPRTGWRLWLKIAVMSLIGGAIYFGVRYLVLELVAALPKPTADSPP